MSLNNNPFLMKILVPSLALFSLVFISCNNQQETANETASVKTEVVLDENNVEDSIVKLIDNNEFDRALNWLNTMDTTSSEINHLLQRVHLNYGLGLMNMTVTTMSQGKTPAGGMNTNMYAAMRQFLAAYHLGPGHEAANVAQAQLQTIMSVYSTMPDRLDAIPGGIRDSLRTIGFSL
jgi:hypothetical protein